MDTPTGEGSKEQLRQLASLCPEDVRMWALEEGYANLKQRIESGAAITAQVSTTLTLLLAGAGGSLAYAVRLVESPSSGLARGAAALCAYFLLLAGLLVFRCLSVDAAPAVHNEPKNLVAQPTATLSQLQAGELVNVQGRIDEQKALNERKARWLNGLRAHAMLAPLVFLAGVYL